MTREDLAESLARLSVETGSLVLGCGYKNSCGTHGCAILRAAMETICSTTPPNEPLTPCDLCMYNPPSSFGGKPCVMCSATSRPPEGEI